MDIRYIAGLFDGEGSVYLVPSTSRGKRNRFYKLEIRITNTFKPVMAELERHLGGWVTTSKHKKRNWKRAYNWSACDRQAETVLKRLLPYLHIKKRQAEMGLEFRKHVGSVGGHESRASRKARSKRQQSFRLQLMQANGRFKPRI